ncbi:hypothetical protein [Kitasatospora cathayae]|uniref:Uncharacterized protein n=1 Tax=Kitasatospora cathayae TaxID=3004092 RepID=A0ABY7QDH0_9ACTN|nr:hypothetical protein [Kitasatospora sp. HUAS 3-15]WBP90424.1 hypothetical protein O1G21_34235 [Kitasatospora sp. HUAS 3-15]
MADLLWDDHVAWLLDPSDGGYLPDVYVADTTTADWQALLDLVVEQRWAFEYSEGDTVLPLPRAETVLSRPSGAECPNLRVWPDPEVCAIFRFLGEEEIDFDVDLRELQGQERLDVLCGFLAAIGRRLGKSVPMFYQGDTREPFLGYDVEADRVRVLWTPPEAGRRDG